MAFELVDGEIRRIAPAILDEALAHTRFHSGDAHLDELLEKVRTKFLNRSLEVRRESLEKLWDAWERLKTLEPGKDNKASTLALLDKVASEPVMREHLGREAMELSDMGNKLMIRHTETDKEAIAQSSQVDYLFHRMFAMISLLLRATGRAG